MRGIDLVILSLCSDKFEVIAMKYNVSCTEIG